MIFDLIQNCEHLKFKFSGVFAADNFPALTYGSIMIMNASKALLTGSHWFLLCQKQEKVYFADLLGLPLQQYLTFYKRLMRYYNEVYQLFKLEPIQTQNSKRCGLFCISFAHIIFESHYPFILYMNNNDLLRFAKHML